MLRPRYLPICRFVGRLQHTTGTSSGGKRFQTSIATKKDEELEEAAETPSRTTSTEHSHENKNTGLRTADSVQPSQTNYETLIQQFERSLPSGIKLRYDVETKAEKQNNLEKVKVIFAAFENALSLGKHPSRSLLESLLRIAHYTQDAGQNSLIMSMFEKYWIPLSPEMTEYAISHLTHQGKFEECLKFCERQIRGDRAIPSEAWETLIRAAILRQKHDFALEVFQRVDTLAEKAGWSARSRLSLTIYYDALVAFADEYYLTGIQWVWNRVIRSGQLERIDLGACTKVLNVCGRNGLPILATEVMQYISMMGFEPATYHYASLIESYCVAGDVKNAFLILSVMRQQGIKPTSVCAGPIVRFLAADLDLVDRAFFTLQDAHAEGQIIDTVALNAVIDASVLMRDLSRAVATYQEHESLGVNPNLDTLNSLITGCVGAQKKELALSLVLAFREKHKIMAGGRTFERLIFVCLLQDDYEDAFKYLEEMKEEGHQPSIRVYSLIIRRCISQDDPRAKIAYEEMKGWGYRHPMIDKLFSGRSDVRVPVITSASTGAYDRLFSFTESDRWFKPREQVKLETGQETAEVQ